MKNVNLLSLLLLSFVSVFSLVNAMNNPYYDNLKQRASAQTNRFKSQQEYELNGGGYGAGHEFANEQDRQQYLDYLEDQRRKINTEIKQLGSRKNRK